MRVLKALRRTWRTLEQVEHFINCYTRSFFFFFFFERKEKEKCHHYDYFQREQNGRNAAGIPAAFRPGRCVPEGSVRNLCQTAWHQPVVPSTSPSFNTQNTESFFLFKFRLWLRLPADNFFEKKKWSADRVRNRMRSLLLLRWVPRHLFFVNLVSLLAVVGNKTMRSDISTKFGRL